jgi:nitroreductase
MSDSSIDAVRTAIRNRRTFKVLAEVENPLEFDATDNQDDFVRQSIADAGWAPFHYDRKVDSIAEPWRCHVLWHNDCRSVAQQMRDWFPDMKPTNKLPTMLAACGALVLATWIPATEQELSDPEKLQTINEEHLAATAAMVQNLLLTLTAGGYGSYWSSGGQFKTQAMFKRLGVGSNEKLAAAVFVEYPQSQDMELERLPGKNRDKRSEATKWCREISLPISS